MSDVRVAMRYAQSVYDLAKERNEIDAIKADLALYTATLKSSPQLAALLRNPSLRDHLKLKALRAIFEGKVTPLTFGLIELMAKKERAYVLGEVAVQFQHLYNHHHRVAEAQVVSAVALTDEQRARIQAIATRVAGSAQATLKESIDPNLLGGFVLTIGDTQIDESLRSKLQLVRTKLTDASYTSKF